MAHWEQSLLSQIASLLLPLLVAGADDHRVVERRAPDVRHQVYQAGRFPRQPEPGNADIPGASGHSVCRGSCRPLLDFIFLEQFMLYSFIRLICCVRCCCRYKPDPSVDNSRVTMPFSVSAKGSFRYFWSSEQCTDAAFGWKDVTSY